MPKNILSFDIEDWFHPEIFDGRFPMETWERLESRVERNTDIILEFLQRKKMTATFFILGWVAERYPELVRRIAREGHEIGSHLFSHKMITKMTPEEFKEELERSLKVLNQLAEGPVIGFRAPTFSITKKTLWALPIMYRAGIRYDSSVFPILHDRYGIPDSPRKPYVIYRDEQGKGGIIEFPMTTVRFLTLNFPLGGGGYFRIYPFWFSRLLMKRCEAEDIPIIFYAHPWEFDKNLPRVNLNFVGKIRHYTGIKKFLERLDRLTDAFEFTSFEKSGMLDAFSLSE
ncbi:MAG: DUF3473 domain-containing protein [Calditrichaeota bacterium]|nr:DUF3473 domain-containing protein [Calditrichota bacterium]